MKRQLIPLALSVWMASPLVAQEPYYPAYGYGYEPGYDSDATSRQFTFNPGNVMERMGNPMRNMFGSSNRGYDDYYPDTYYLGAGYAPPAYPPAYGYPAYPAYPQPYPDSGYAPQMPDQPDYAVPYGQPSTPPAPVQARPEPSRQMQLPTFEETPPAASAYRPRFANPDQTHFRFRPLEEEGEPAAASAPGPAEDVSGMTDYPLPAPVYREPEPLAPLTYPGAGTPPEPLAPLTYPQAQATPSVPEHQLRDPQTGQDPGLRFRPLDKPGYSSDLQE